MTEMFIVGGFMTAVIILFVIGLWRGRRIITANERVVKGQQEIIALNRQVLAAQEQQAAALERIADHLSKGR